MSCDMSRSVQVDQDSNNRGWDGLRRGTGGDGCLSDRPLLFTSRFMVTKKGKYNVNDTQINSLFTSSSFNSGLLLLQNFIRHVK